MSKIRERPDMCELAEIFRYGHYVAVPGKDREVHTSREFPASEWHHVIGKDAIGRTDDNRCGLWLSHYFHQTWFAQHHRPGRVACCFALKRMGYLDWDFLSELSRQKWPGIFETDDYVRQCSQFPAVEKMRRSLVG